MGGQGTILQLQSAPLDHFMVLQLLRISQFGEQHTTFVFDINHGYCAAENQG
jgi:hypothetical protein